MVPLPLELSWLGSGPSLGPRLLGRSWHFPGRARQPEWACCSFCNLWRADRVAQGQVGGGRSCPFISSPPPLQTQKGEPAPAAGVNSGRDNMVAYSSESGWQKTQLSKPTYLEQSPGSCPSEESIPWLHQSRVREGYGEVTATWEAPPILPRAVFQSAQSVIKLSTGLKIIVITTRVREAFHFQ